MKRGINKRIVSLLLCLTISIQNTACMAKPNNTFDNIDLPSQSITTDSKDDDIDATLNFFAHELSKVDGIDSRITFTSEETNRILESVSPIFCTNTTNWTEESLYEKIDDNTKAYIQNKTNTYSALDIINLYNLGKDETEAFQNLEIGMGIKNALEAQIREILKNNNRQQIHQFTNLNIVVIDAFKELDEADLLARFRSEDNVIEISLTALKENYDYFKECNDGLFMIDAAKLLAMHEMDHVKETACPDQIANGKEKNLSIDGKNYSFILEANAENDLYHGDLKQENPALLEFTNSHDILAYMLLKKYSNYCEIENLLLCINAFDNSSNVSDFYQAIYNNDLSKIYDMLNISSDEEKITLNKIIYSVDAMANYNDFAIKAKEQLHISGEVSNDDFLKINDLIGEMEYVDIMKLTLKNLIFYNEKQNDLTIEDNLNLYKFLLYTIYSEAAITNFNEWLDITDYYFYQEYYDSMQKLENIFFTYLARRYAISFDEVCTLSNGDTVINDFYEYAQYNDANFDNLLQKFPKLQTLLLPTKDAYLANKDAINGKEYYYASEDEEPIKLTMRHSTH